MERNWVGLYSKTLLMHSVTFYNGDTSNGGVHLCHLAWYTLQYNTYHQMLVILITITCKILNIGVSVSETSF